MPLPPSQQRQVPRAADAGLFRKILQTATENARGCAAFLALPVLRAALQGAIRQQDTTAGTRVA